MILKIRNGRDEWASRDTDSKSYWLGREDDDTSRVLGEMVSVPKLISQFYPISPWDGVRCDTEFDSRVRSVAASCFAHDNPTITPKDDDERAAFSAVWQFATRIRDNNAILASNDCVFSGGIGVAGALDLAFRCNGSVYVCAWKTGNLMLPAKCKFIAPFAHLVADPVTIGSLQCAMLQEIADVGGYFGYAQFAAPRLLWVRKNDGKWQVDALSCRDLRREAATMMMCRPYTQWYNEWKERCPF